MFLFIWNTLDSATYSLSGGQILQLYASMYQLFFIWSTCAFVFTHLTFRVCIPSPQWREFCSLLILHGDHGSTAQEYWLHSLSHGTASYTCQEKESKLFIWTIQVSISAETPPSNPGKSTLKNILAYAPYAKGVVIALSSFIHYWLAKGFLSI